GTMVQWIYLPRRRMLTPPLTLRASALALRGDGSVESTLPMAGLKKRNHGKETQQARIPARQRRRSQTGAPLAPAASGSPNDASGFRRARRLPAFAPVSARPHARGAGKVRHGRDALF